MYIKMIGEDVSGGHEVVFYAIDSEPVHAQVLRE